MSNHKPEYTTAINGIDTGVRVYHYSTPSIHGTVTQMAVFTAKVHWDNGVDAWQSIGVLRPVLPRCPLTQEHNAQHPDCRCWRGHLD